MKISKLKIKGYKLFDDIEFDFTDSEGKVLDVIVIAGINGTGKTSLLQLLSKLFSNNSNKEKDIIICNKIESEYVVSKEDFLFLKQSINEIDESFKRHKLGKFKYLIKHLNIVERQNKYGYIRLSYELNKKSDKFNVKNNDFPVFLSLQRGNFFKILYFTAHSDELNNSDKKSPGPSIKRDGIVLSIDVLGLKEEVKQYIVESVKNSLLEHRKQTGEEAIKYRISEINQLLQGIDLKTKLVDIEPEMPIFESFNGKRVLLDDLSSGERQIYYRATLLNQLNFQKGLILVDEPENSLHPTWQKDILKLYQNVSLNNQVILATHSPHIIASVHPKNLFILYMNEETKKIEVINAAKAGLHTRGLEPNRILKEVMGTPLRDFDTQKRIDEITDLLRLNSNKVEEDENWEKIELLRADLGKQDPFIIRLNHQLAVIEAKKHSAV